MNKQVYEELIQFFEQRNLGTVASGLKKDLKGVLQQQAKDKKSAQANKENVQEKTLHIIRSAVEQQQMKAKQEEVKEAVGSLKHPFGVNRANFSFNKEETEEIMEKLMNRVVAKPNLVADDKLNAKIEKIFSVEAFQKMVENADIFQDLSSSSIFNQSELMQRSVNNNLSFKKVLPTHSQLKEEEDEAPYLPNENNDLIHKDINDSVNELFAPSSPSKIIDSQLGKQNVFQVDESFSNKNAKNQNLDLEISATVKVGKEPENRQSKYTEEQLESMMQSQNLGKMPSIIHGENPGDVSSFFDNSKSFVFQGGAAEEHPVNKEGVDDYTDDDDPGFEVYMVNEENFVASCKELADQHNFPSRAIKPDTKEQMAHREKYKKQQQQLHQVKNDDSAVLLQKLQSKKEKPEGKHEEQMDEEDDDDGRKASVLPKWIKFQPSNDEFYPAEFESVIYDCYHMRVVFDREKTGFEETKEFPIVINSIIAGRYQVVEYLGSAAFSKAIQCYDIHTEQMVCMKIIENNKDYFDQSVDEIKLLRFINANCENLDEKHLLKLIDFFYHKEHLFIVTELLRDNLYEYSKYNREIEKKAYFTVGRLQRITVQILNALDFIHNLRLIHCDLKPENILIKSYSKCEVKVIDFGSSCFIHDHLSSYVQSRSYRAPEVILGCRYDYKIDMWSLGCILAELYTGYVLFQNDSVQGLLARVIGIIGPVPEYMMKEGRLVSNFFTREGLIYQEAGMEDDQSSQNLDDSRKKAKALGDDELKIHILVAKKTTLKHRLKCDDPYFVDFVKQLLEVDPTKRPTAKEALAHPWLAECHYQIENN